MPPTRIDTRGWTNAWICVPLVSAFLAFTLCIPGAAQAVTFTGPTNIAVGSAPQSVVTGNFNADADPDLAVVNQGSNNVSVLLGGAGASFGAPVNYVAGTTPLAVVSADFNGDADPELAVANEASNNVSILTGGAGGTFSAPSNFVVGSTPQSLGVGDFNGDLDLDLAVVNEGSNNVSILLGGAGASFGAPTNFSVGGLPRAVTVGDFNADSDPDLAVANEATNNVSVLVGASGGSFTGPTNLPVCSAPTWIASGNFNGDTDPDLAVVNELCHNVSILLGGAAASFGTATNFAAGNLPDGVTVGEFSGDSDPDLAVANQGSDNISVLVGDAGGTFVGPTDFAIGDGPTSVAVGDFDGDADQDLAVTNELVDNLGILLLDSGPVGYVRPKGASPMRIALVPAFAACTAPNRLHGPPALSGGSSDASCAPPVQTSNFLTIGAPDANGAAANSVGSVLLKVIAGGAGPPEDSDVAIEVNVTDVRCRAGVLTCGATNSQGGADYTGELTPNAAFRLTDANNGGGSDRATVQDQVLAGSAQVQVPCTATASTSIGATCAWTTTLDAVNPGIVLDGKRAVWQLGQVEVLDGGSDGEASTTPNSRFLVQGIYAP
jgi:predicted NUDIX family NTP pyrophosphohydrolase